MYWFQWSYCSQLTCFFHDVIYFPRETLYHLWQFPKSLASLHSCSLGNRRKYLCAKSSEWGGWEPVECCAWLIIPLRRDLNSKLMHFCDAAYNKRVMLIVWIYHLHEKSSYRNLIQSQKIVFSLQFRHWNLPMRQSGIMGKIFWIHVL